MVRIIVRVLSLYFGSAFLSAVVSLVANLQGGHAGSITSFGAHRMAAVICALIIAVVAPYASILLWRFKERGRRAALYLAATIILYYGSVYGVLGGPHIAVRPVLLGLFVNVVVLILLLIHPVTRSFANDGKSS